MRAWVRPYQSDVDGSVCDFLLSVGEGEGGVVVAPAVVTEMPKRAGVRFPFEPVPADNIGPLTFW
ncbi:MAG: hypothetical protein JWP80_2924 [Pseudomonas sp.]|nr:hypothetical protein [Pseudomonas sp.]